MVYDITEVITKHKKSVNCISFHTAVMQHNRLLVRDSLNQPILVIEFSLCREGRRLHVRPLINCHLELNQCPGSSYSVDEGGDELCEFRQESLAQNECSLGTSYEETGSDCNSYNSLADDDDDQLTLYTCRQCCTVGQDELVIPKHRNCSLSSDSNHTIVCRYCREEVKYCYYNDHLARCSEHCEHYRCGIGNTRRHYNHDHRSCSLEEISSSVANCTAVQERCRYCREELRNCYHDGHLVRYQGYFTDHKFSNSTKIGPYNQNCEIAAECISEEESQICGSHFTVNCTAVCH